MQVFRDLQSILIKKPVVEGLTIGNFDGVHLGHQSLIHGLREKIKTKPLAVLTFDPHPREVISGIKIKKILSIDDQLECFNKLGCEVVFIIPFNKTLAESTADNFFLKFIWEPLSPSFITVGHDFKFGKNREGNELFLKQLALKHHFCLDVIDAYKINNVVVSSSMIRTFIENGDVESAEVFLGHNFYVKGKVQEGFKRGHQLGVPTANLSMQAGLVQPKAGVYLARVEWDGSIMNAITNVGFNPTFSNPTPSIETHILNFNKNLYGEIIKIEFIKRLRDEKKFNSLLDLKNQIQKDIAVAKVFFSGS